MPSLLSRLAPGFTDMLNLVVDLALLLAAILLSTHFSDRPLGDSADPSVIWFGIAAIAVWVVTSTGLRRYDPSSTDREALDDAALVTVLVMAVTTVLAVTNLMLPETAAVPRVAPFLLVFWPVVMALRLFVFRSISNREGPLDEVLIIG